jgi:sugar-specific transcriptional regulator TrmB
MGFSPSEAQVYLTLLETPHLTVSEIAHAAQLKRSSCVLYVESLLTKEAVISVPSGKRTKYLAVAPNHLRIRLQKQHDDAKQSLSELQALYRGPHTHLKTQFHEGKREMQQLYRDAFHSGESVYTTLSPRSFFKVFSPEEYGELAHLASEQACRMHHLIVSDEHTHKIHRLHELYPNPGTRVQRLPGTFRTQVQLLVFGNKTILIDLQDLSAIALESTEIAHFFKQLHGLL